MRQVSLLLSALLLIVPPALADDDETQETLLHGKTENGFYLAPTLHVSRVSGDIVYFSGFRGAWSVNHRFAFGYGAYGMGGTVAAPGTAREFYAVSGQPRTALELDFRYRGAELEYIGDWKNLFHWGIYALIGSGTVSLGDPDDRTFHHDDTVFIVLPTLTGMLNVTRWMTAVADISYRAVSDVDLGGVEASDLNGLSAGVELRIGKF